MVKKISQPIQTNPPWTRMLELAEMDLKMITVTGCHRWTKLRYGSYKKDLLEI